MGKIKLSSYKEIYFNGITIPKRGERLLSNFSSNDKINWDELYFCCLGNHKNPELWIKHGYLLKVEPDKIEVNRHVVKIQKIYSLKTIINILIEGHTFKSIDPQLEKLGISQKLIESLPIDHHFYGIVDICSCGIEDCYSRKGWIIKKVDGFIIPFFYSTCGPDSWLEMNIFDLEPESAITKPNAMEDALDLDLETSIFDSNGNITDLEKQNAYNPYQFPAFNADFELNEENLFPIDYEFFDQLGVKF